MKNYDWTIRVPLDIKSVFAVLMDPDFTPVYAPEVEKETIIDKNTRKLEFIDWFDENRYTVQLKIDVEDSKKKKVIRLSNDSFYEQYSLIPSPEKIKGKEHMDSTDIHFEKFDSNPESGIRGRTGAFETFNAPAFLFEQWGKTGKQLKMMKHAFTQLGHDKEYHKNFKKIMKHHDLLHRWVMCMANDNANLCKDNYFSVLYDYNDKYLPRIDIKSRNHRILISYDKVK